MEGDGPGLNVELIYLQEPIAGHRAPFCRSQTRGLCVCVMSFVSFIEIGRGQLDVFGRRASRYEYGSRCMKYLLSISLAVYIKLYIVGGGAIGRCRCCYVG